jgi:hypothetical protein
MKVIKQLQDTRTSSTSKVEAEYDPDPVRAIGDPIRARNLI